MKKVYLILVLFLIIILISFLLDNFISNGKELQSIQSVQDIDFEENQVIPWGIELIGKGNSKETKKKIKVAVLDSGINKNHKDLNGKVIKEYNAIQPQKPAEDILNHGTAIAGIITANDNDFGITGVSQNVEIYSVKVINDDGKIEKPFFLDGFEWAISQNVNIINISSGFPNDFPELQTLIDTAVEKGIIIVAASGNTFGLNAQFPARYENVLSISAINEQKKSPNFAANGKVDFVAPGVEILSLNNQGGYSTNKGSSYSTAYVTGIIAEFLLNNDFKQKDDISLKARNFLEKSSLNLEASENIVGAGIPVLHN